MQIINKKICNYIIYVQFKKYKFVTYVYRISTIFLNIYERNNNLVIEKERKREREIYIILFVIQLNY